MPLAGNAPFPAKLSAFQRLRADHTTRARIPLTCEINAREDNLALAVSSRAGSGFTFSSMAGFPNNSCYAVLQGTGVAAAHVSAGLALLASQNPPLRHHVSLLKQLKTRQAINLTPPASATDTSPMDRSGTACSGGFCHLGGKPIKSKEAYGHGVLDLSLSP